MAFWRKITEVKCHLHDVTSRPHIINMSARVDLDCLAEVTFVKFLYYEVTLSPFPQYCLEGSVHSPYIGCGDLCFLSLRVKYLDKLSEIFCMAHLSLLPSYAITYLYQYELRGVYFIFVIILSYSIYLVA